MRLLPCIILMAGNAAYGSNVSELRKTSVADTSVMKSTVDVLNAIVFPDSITAPVSPLDSILSQIFADTATSAPELSAVERLTDEDFRRAAEQLGVEIAAIKAVVEIEAGKSHQGFHAPGVPLINFDLTMFRRFAKRNGIDLAKYMKSHDIVFSSPRAAQYGSRQAAQHARLERAYTIDRRTAVEGTFWGMFQIGGFNWRKCGAKDIDEFVALMSRSERDQLDMFVKFLDNSGLTRYLKAKDWAAFARGYNGPSYARRGYHTRLASAYARYKGGKED